MAALKKTEGEKRSLLERVGNRAEEEGQVEVWPETRRQDGGGDALTLMGKSLPGTCTTGAPPK